MEEIAQEADRLAGGGDGPSRGLLASVASYASHCVCPSTSRSIRISPTDQLLAEYIVPSVFNRQVADAVARAVATAAVATGVARREHAQRSDV